jgi:alpha-tubulin suppressor-like RCC1 family protein
MWGSEGLERGGGQAFWTPYQVRLFGDDARFTAVSANWSSFAALSTDGLVYLWDSSTLVELRRVHPKPERLRLEPLEFPGGARISRMSVGSSGHLLALAAGGDVFASGDNRYGQLGDGTRDHAATPVPVAGLPDDDRVVDAATSSTHSVALTESGQVWAWGANQFGQLGDGTDTELLTPTLATGFPQDDPVVEVHPAYGFTTVLTASGKVYHAGAQGLGYSRPEPEPGPRPVERVTGFPKVTRIKTMATGAAHWLAAAEDNTLYAWGDNAFGELGVDPQIDYSFRPRPVRGLPAGPGILQLAAGRGHSVALAADGSMCAWGDNEGGQLGTGLEYRWKGRRPHKIPWTR